jgi:hypothetical protein
MTRDDRAYREKCASLGKRGARTDLELGPRVRVELYLENHKDKQVGRNVVVLRAIEAGQQ